jgi:hypothetical protein
VIALSLIAAAAAGGPEVFDGEVRVVGTQLTELPVDAEGSTHGGTPWLDSRLRFSLGGGERVEVRIGGDLLTGVLTGTPYAGIDERSVSALSLEGFAPREAWARTRLGPVDTQLGLTTSHWGLGMIANDGNHDPWFGRADQGDRVIRLRGTTSPKEHLYLTLAADRVLADELAAWRNQQAAYQGIASVLRATADSTLGVYAVYRHQIEQEEDRLTRAGVVDVFADKTFGGDELALRLSAEAAGILGDTDRATTYNSRDKVGVRQLGAAGQAALVTKAEHKLVLRGGYASGDGNPDDGVTHDFTFDHNFDVGMVLFDEVWGGIEAATHTLLSDPERSGQPPDGVETLVTEGSFRRAVFGQPLVEVAATPWLAARAGVMAAWSTAPISQPFYTYRAGGTPHNHHDLPTSDSYIGAEVDWALLFKPMAERESEVDPQLLLQGGHAFLGPALQGAGPDRIDLYMLNARLRW